MNQLIGTNTYIQNSIATSRIFQEDLSIIQGNSAYGALAALIDTNIDAIDGFAEYVGSYLAQNDVISAYRQQYGDNKISGVVKRTFADEQSVYDNQVKRRNKAFLESVAVEAGIKIGARIVQNWANEKDKYGIFEQVYTILYAFAKEEDAEANVRRVNIELGKIRSSFPLSNKEKNKLTTIDLEKTGLFEREIPLLSQKGNNGLIDNIAYLLYSLYAQKYGASEEKEDVLLDYYSFLGLHGRYASEMLREHKNAYEQIANDQIKYLKIARGMVNNFSASIPDIDVNGFAQRAIAMAEYDPYSIIRKKTTASGKVKKKISDVFFENPEFVMNAGALAVAQLDLDDDGKESMRNKFVDWGMDDRAVETILKQSTEIKDESY